MASFLPSIPFTPDLNDPATFGKVAFALAAALPAGYTYLKKSVHDLSLKNNDPEIRKKRSLLHEKIQKSTAIPDDIDYIIIGSGMSGLSCGAILARLGRKVVVLEQHSDTVGGGSHMFEMKGFHFDSGLHYTVPWSVPIFALTCLKKPKDCVPFDLMTEEDGTIDKIYLVGPNEDPKAVDSPPFRMKYHETHIKDLYEMYPEDKEGLDKYMKVSDDSQDFVKVFLLSKLLPKWLQKLFWKLVPANLMAAAGTTAKKLLPQFIKNKKLISLLSSMWIDTGARPDRATFMLSASVFRGISKEGGCYPRGGSTQMAKELVTVIESNGGHVWIRSDVQQIVFDSSLNRITGVRLGNGVEIKSRKGVISSTGYLNTMNNLIAKEVTERFNVPRSLPVKQSSGFVMANIGVSCSPDVIGATKANSWHIPVDASGDLFGPMDKYFEDPLGPETQVPAFITFPSLKDSSFGEADKVTCQMLIMAEFDWFKQFLPTQVDKADEEFAVSNSCDRLAGYEQLKEMWKKRALSIFLRYYPKAAPYVTVCDISTPLSIQYYLRSPKGGAVGLDVAPQRFCDESLRENLDPITKIPGLSLTGQDVTLCGVTLCQLAGVITAFRLEGFWAALKIIAQSVILGDN
eukprot:gene945-1027_t